MTSSVLVVETSPDLRWLIAHALQRAGGFDVSCLAIGQDDLEATVADLCPDAVIIEVDGFDVDAASLVRALVAASPHTRVIATVALGDGRVRTDVLEAGGTDIIRKGVPMDALVRQLRSALDARPPTIEPSAALA